MKGYVRWGMVILATMGVLVGSGRQAVANVTLEFTSLPSAQGWTYIDGGIAPLPAADAFSVDGTTLTLNTIGDGQVAVLYALDNALDPLLPYTLSLRARALQNEPLGNVSTFFSPWIQVQRESALSSSLTGLSS